MTTLSGTTLSGGKTVYGATLGILMLETRFPRIRGDVGNALTWPFPVQYRVVRGATPGDIVLGDARARLEAFVEAGRDLVATGCDGVATNCGFLSPIQHELAAALGVPVASSSLLQVPLVASTLPPGKRVGILTISAATLGEAHLAAAGVPPGTPIVGTDADGEFTRKILTDAATIDFARCRDEVLEAARALVSGHEGIGAIVLECTNMVPYARDVRRATGVAVHSIHSFLEWFQAGLLPRGFALELDDPRP